MFLTVKNLCLPLAALGLIILPLATSVPAHADSYALTVVATTQHENFYGIDATGDFVVNLGADVINPCGTGPCFATYYVNQTSPVISTSAPILSYDDGAVCSPVLFPGFTPSGGNHGVCNNGHSMVEGSDATHLIGVWDGPNPPVAPLLIGSFDGGFINASGDAVFIDGFNDTLVSAVDLTTDTPEPSSFVLLGTGCLTLLGTLRRYRRV